MGQQNQPKEMELQFPIAQTEGFQNTDLEALSPGLHRLQQVNLSDYLATGLLGPSNVLEEVDQSC
jgi:hypothetical protein